MTKSAKKKGLSSAHKKFLRGKAHHLKPIVLVGQSGVTEGLVGSVNDALLAHELIKVRLREPENKKTMAQDLATLSKSHLCGLIGHTAILYRPHPEKPQIQLPR
jgi:RNA-binding protein